MWASTFADIPTTNICGFEHYLNGTVFLKQLELQSLAGGDQDNFILMENPMLSSTRWRRLSATYKNSVIEGQ